MVVVKEVTNMFWGVTLYGGKHYTQVVEQSFHISMAALEPKDTGDSKPVSVMIQHDKAEFMLCTLQQKKLYQQALDLNFTEGEEITFFLNGDGIVHLSGYLADEPFEGADPSADASLIFGSSDESEEESDEDEDSSDEDEEDEDSEDEEIPTLQEIAAADTDEDDEDEDEWKPEKKGTKRKKKQKDTVTSKKKKEESDDDDDEEGDDEDFEMSEEDDEDEDEEEEEEDENRGSYKEQPKPTKKDSQEKTKTENGTPSTDKKKKKKKKKKQAASEEAPNKSSTPAEKNQSEKKNASEEKKSTEPKKSKWVTKGGINVEEVKEGHGPLAKTGKTVHVYYNGKLSNGKMFDALQKGKPFRFKLGKNEVIKGWDLGLEGMKVGGKRKLTIPPKMGYGSQRVGSIPPNSTLVFDVELKAVS